MLECWCLNFKGRVKVASVKNYQLHCLGDSHARVAMQFGKVGGRAGVGAEWLTPSSLAGEGGVWVGGLTHHLLWSLPSR